MAVSCRFAFAVHVLAVLAHERAAGGVCSERIAGSVNTNPVVIRRLLSQLRRAGLVKTQKGSSGGAALTGAPEDISLVDIYRAVEPAAAFGTHRQKPNPRCPVGAGIERVLDEVFSSAQNALECELARRTLREVLDAMADATPRGRKAA